MRTKSVRGAGVLIALSLLVALAPARSLAQNQIPGGLAGNYSPPDRQLPYPLYSNRPDVGGPFVYGGFVMYQQSNPIKSQPIGYRGFVTSDDSVLGAAGSAGTFVGTRNDVVDANQITGPLSFQPGFNIGAGWKFSDGSALSIDFTWISEAQYNAAATLAQPVGSGLTRSDLADTFLFSPVYNFPSDFAGPPDKVFSGGPNGVFGIWNGASAMTLLFLQRAQQFQFTYRKPFYETETYRASGLAGPRFFWIDEKFRWVTTDVDGFGNSSPQFVGIYNNNVSNRMYGVYTGLQQEWYVGCGLAFMLTTNAAVFGDFVKEKANYVRGDDMVGNKRARAQFRIVPELQVTPSIMWYPLEGIQLNLGWDFFCFFNTVASTTPVDFNYGSLTPGYSDVFRYFTGLQASIALIF